MKKIGTYVWWSADSVRVTTTELTDLGLGAWLTNQQFRTFLRKAVDKVKRNYRTETSKSERSHFSEGDGKFRYEWIDVVRVQNDDGSKGIETSTFSIFVDNKTGHLSTSATEDTREYRIYKEVSAEYRALADSSVHQGTEVSKLIQKFLDKECKGIKCKKGGGVWYIDRSKLDQIHFLRDACKSIGLKIVISSLVDDDDNAETISDIVSVGLKEKITRLVKTLISSTESLKSEKLEDKQIESRLKDIDSIKEELELYKETIKEFYVGFLGDLRKVESAVNTAKDAGAKKSTFLELLQSCEA